MELCTSLDPAGAYRVGVVIERGVEDVTDQVPAAGVGGPMRRLLAAGSDLRGLRADGPVAPASRLLAPVPDPTEIVAVPVDHVDHLGRRRARAADGRLRDRAEGGGSSSTIGR